MVSNGQGGDDFSGIEVEDSHYFAAASFEKAPMLPVNGHAAGRGAWSGRPAVHNFQVAGIYFDHLAFILQIVVDKSIAVGRGEFRTSAKINSTGDFAAGGVNRRGAVASPIESKDTRCGWIENDAVGFLARRNFTERLQSLQIENGHAVGLAVANESSAHVIRDGNTMHTWGRDNFAGDLAGIDIEDLHLRAV